MTALALDIGSTRFAAVQAADDVGLDAVREIPVPTTQTWQQCKELLLEAAGSDEVEGVGISCAGPIDLDAGVVAPPAVAEWRAGFPLTESVQEVFPAARVNLGIDGACHVLAERTLGVLREMDDSVAIYVSDTIVGGTISRGYALIGRTGNAGQFGHVLLSGFDDPCACGGRGCLEAVASEGAVLRWARARGWDGDSVGDLVAAEQSGEQIAAAALERAGTALGQAIVSMAAVLDVEVFSVNGGLTEPGTALWKALNKAVAIHARASSMAGLRVVPSTVGELSSLIGAGLLSLIAKEAARQPAANSSPGG